MKLPVQPMLAAPSVSPDGDRYPHHFERDDYSFEIKWDGYRMIAVTPPTHGGPATLFSRQGNRVTNDWPEIAWATPPGTVLDGEVIAIRGGKSSFQALQNAKRMSVAARADAIRFVAFDILEYGNNSVQHWPYLERRNLLAGELTGNPIVTFSHAVADGRAAWGMVLEHQLEGLIAKPVNSRYVQNNRGIWLKHKRNVVQTFEVIGYTSGEGSRSGSFGALVLGEWIGDRLRFAGKCGTGFDRQATAETFKRMREHVTKDAPVDPGQQAIVRQKLGGRTVVWLRPALRATVEFNDFSDGRIVRMGSFKGMEDAGERPNA